jgi:phosphohistidine phosphatase SixA
MRKGRAAEVPHGTSPAMLNYSAREIVAEAMRVMLLRHAKSKKAQGAMSDHARRLKGRGFHRYMADFLRRPRQELGLNVLEMLLARADEVATQALKACSITAFARLVQVANWLATSALKPS